MRWEACYRNFTRRDSSVISINIGVKTARGKVRTKCNQFSYFPLVSSVPVPLSYYRATEILSEG